MKTVTAPQFAESVSEGDVRWEKGMCIVYVTHILALVCVCSILKPGSRL